MTVRPHRLVSFILAACLPAAFLTADEHAATKLDQGCGGCGEWAFVKPASGEVIMRHEGAFAELGGKLYLLGGRRLPPVQAYDPKTGAWTTVAEQPVDLHHFQGVTWGTKIVCAGAMEGRFPGETPVPHVYLFDTATNTWEKGIEIPEGRRRGGAGAVLHDGWIYLVSGITDGHRSGWVPWVDRFNPATGEWQILPDAPTERDHFQAGVIHGKLIAAGGRRSGKDGVMGDVRQQVDILDLATMTWSTLPPESNIPTPRAGCMATVVGDELVIAGGEVGYSNLAKSVVEGINPLTGKWTRWPDMPEGRHASQLVLFDGALWIASGANFRGGRETDTMLRLPLRKQP